MFVTPQYFTDLGISLGYLQMDIAFIGENIRSLTQIKDLNEVEGLIPISLESQLLRFNSPCKSIEVIPRFLILSLQGESQRVKLAYPFRPNTLEWQVFWNDILSNSRIISVQGIGESLSSSFLRRHLA